MANTIPPVLIELQLETARIAEQMTQMRNQFDNFGQTVTKQNSFMEKFKATAAGMFTGNLMAQGFNMVTGAIKGAIQEAQQYEVLMAKTEAVIKSTGGAAGVSAQHILDQASALEQVAAVDEAVILNGQNVIATFTNIRNVAGQGNDVFDQTTKAALDLSVALGQDMQSSAIQLGKALNDPVKGITALTRVGVTFSAEQKNMIKALVESGDTMGAQKVILAELNREFGGAAAAAGDTFAGAIFRAKDKVQDFARNLVSNLQPVLLSIGKTIGDLYNKFLAPLFGWLSKNKEAIAAFATVVITAVVAIKLYNAALIAGKAIQTAYAVAQVLMAGGQLATIASTNGLAASMLVLNATLAANPAILVVAGLAALAAAFVVAWNKSETFRKVVILAFQGVLSGVSFAIRAIADFVNFANKYLMLPFKTLLQGLSKLPGVGKYAKAALEFMDDIPTKLDSAADKVDKFSAGLTKLQDKKISIPGFGGKKASDSTTPGAAGAPDASSGAAAEKLAKANAKKLEKAQADAAKIYTKMNGVIQDANEKRAKITKDYNDKVAKLNKDAAEAELKVRAEYESKAQDLRDKANTDQLAVIKKGQDMLRNAFATGAKFDLAKMFDDSDKSGAGLLQKMKDKFAAIKGLQAKAGALASAGFSQTFIQDVVAQGPEIGGSMADAILSATPDTQAQLKELYYGLEDVSKYGLDALAKQMSTSTSFATRELMEEYAQIGTDLTNALENNQDELNGKIKEIQNDLKTALLEAQMAYEDAINELEKDTMQKLANLQAELKKTADAMVALNKQSLGVSTLANSPAAPILAGTQPLSKIDSGGAGVLAQYNYNTTINGINMSDPDAAAKAVDNTLRFGSTQSIGAGKFRALERMALGD